MKTKILSMLNDHSVRYALRYSRPAFCPSWYQTNPMNKKASVTQKQVCHNALLMVICEFFLLNRPRSKTSASISKTPKARYVSCSEFMEKLMGANIPTMNQDQ